MEAAALEEAVFFVGGFRDVEGSRGLASGLASDDDCRMDSGDSDLAAVAKSEEDV